MCNGAVFLAKATVARVVETSLCLDGPRKESVMVRTRVGVIARVLAIAALLAINAVVDVRADDDCYTCPIGNNCFQVVQGSGRTGCVPLGADSCHLFGDSCTVS